VSVFTRFRNPPAKSIPAAPKLNPDPRASASDVRSMTGSSVGASSQARTHNTKEGDHRSRPHAGPATRSQVPRYKDNGPPDAA
jgi:hypothetical protein